MSTIHTEKIDHAVSRLEEAGLSSGDDAAAATITTASSSGSKSHLPAIIGGVVGGVIFVAVILFLVICLRRRRKNRAYNAVHRGVDMPKAPGGPGMSGGLMPLWMSNNAPSISHTPPSAHPDNSSDIEKLRRYSSSGLASARESFSSARSDATIGPPTAAFGGRDRSRSPSPGRGRSPNLVGTSRSRSHSRDLFNAEREPAEVDSMMVRSKFREDEFGSAFGDVNTGYGGDKRSGL